MSWFKGLQRSLYWRLLGVFLLTGVSLIVVLFLYVHIVIKPHEKIFREGRAKHHLNYLIKDIGIPANLERAQSISKEQSLKILILGPDVKWASEPDLLKAGPPELLYQLSPNTSFIKFAGGRYASVQRGEWIFYFGPGPGPFPFELAAAWTLWIVLFVMLLVLAANYFAVRWLIRPIQDIKLGAEKISGGDLNVRISTRRSGELGELIDSVNTMADSLQQMLEGKRELLLAISHELRTPVTRAKVALALVEDKTLYQNIEDELDCMEQLIAALLESERLNTPHVRINREPININALVEDVVIEFGADWLKLCLPAGSVQAYVDALRIKLLMSNLINNAALHRDGGGVEVELFHNLEEVIIIVQDHGMGISDKDLPLVTEPFFRADKARTRQTGGFGLGLYLCKLITKAHGGQLLISSEVGDGTEVKVILPKEPT